MVPAAAPSTGSSTSDLITGFKGVSGILAGVAAALSLLSLSA